MDRLTLSHIDEELDSSEVAALCFLCRDVVNRKRLEGISDAKGLFLRLEEKGLLENRFFLYKLLQTIRREDLLDLLETDGRHTEETDANPILSDYRVMLYEIYQDMTVENLNKMKFLLSSSLGRRQTEACNTALDVFVEMEKSSLLSNTKLGKLHETLQELDQQLALTITSYMQGVNQQPQTAFPPHVSMDYQVQTQPYSSTTGAQTIDNTSPLSVSETQPGDAGRSICADAEPTAKPSPPPDETEYYSLTHFPRGVCAVISNENFLGVNMKRRVGTRQDEEALSSVFTSLGFKVVVHKNLTAENIRQELKTLSERNFMEEDVLEGRPLASQAALLGRENYTGLLTSMRVVCVLSHGTMGCVYGSDEQLVFLKEVTRPFTSGRVPTLAGKPKLFFIQACQGDSYQLGSAPCPPRPRQEEEGQETRLEEDAGAVYGETVPSDADFLLGMATVPECKSFRNTSTGSIYIQELCKQLMRSANSSEMDDILTVLTRVNREVSKGEYLRYKQMPEPKYTLTKKLVLKCV